MPTRIAVDKLKNDLLAMGEMCESALDTAIMALLDRDTDLACYVMDYDSQIDELELNIDRQCTDLLAGGNLKGDPLRFVASAAKINNDLERVGDLAVEIAENVLFLVRERSILPQVIDFMDMVNQVGQMMRESINAVLEMDIDLAWKLIDERRIVDDEMQVILRELMDVMHTDGRTIERCVHLLFVVKSLMRVADQASNIAEEVIFMCEGVTVRHHVRELHTLTHRPLASDESAEVEKVEVAILESRRPREELRKEAAAAKQKVKSLTREEVSAAAETGRSKAKEARKRILKLRAGRRD